MLTASASMFLSGSQIETTSTGATWMSRQRSLFPYQPAPIRPTRLGLPLIMSRASAPSVGSAASAAAADVEACAGRHGLGIGFHAASMNSSLWPAQPLSVSLLANHALA